MKIEPNYPDEIIVLIKHRHIFTWYVSEKELWIMNLTMLNQDFDMKMEELGKKDEKVIIDDERTGLEILDEINIDIFQDRIEQYKVSYKELNEYFSFYPEQLHYQEVKEISPVFYIDFDNKQFYSFLTEPGSYELYIPEGWNGIYTKEIEKTILNQAKNS